MDHESIFVVWEMYTYDHYERGCVETSTIRGVYKNSNAAHRKLFHVISAAIGKMDSKRVTDDDRFRYWFAGNKQKLGLSDAMLAKDKAEQCLVEVRDRVKEYCANEWPTTDWEQRANYLAKLYDFVRVAASKYPEEAYVVEYFVHKDDDEVTTDEEEEEEAENQ